MTDSEQFKTLAQSLLKDSLFADFEIYCGGISYRIHRAIVACHTEYFKALLQGSYEESEKRAIELKEDNPHAVKLMIDYFYEFDYEDAHEEITNFAKILELNAAVYVVADKYQVPDLKKLAVEHFAMAAPASALRLEDPTAAIRLAFTGTSTTDRVLRDLVLDSWTIFGDVLLKERGPAFTASMVQELPEFAAEVLHRTAVGSPLKFSATCGMNNYPRKYDGKDVVKAFEQNCHGCNKPVAEHNSVRAIRNEVKWTPFWIKFRYG